MSKNTIELFLSPTPLNEARTAGKVAIVIDVLRASTSICAAIKNGCREVIPVASLGKAGSLKANLDRELVLMCGERGGLKVEGFDLGNSPFEYSQAVVKNKVLIYASTNGAGAILSCSGSAVVLICSFVNLSAVASYIIRRDSNIVIICAGKEGDFSLEDTLCGGMLIDRLSVAGNYAEANDATTVAHMLYKSYRDKFEEILRQSDHARYLEQLGFGADLAYAAAIDSCDVVPQFYDGKIRNAESISDRE